MSPSAKKRKPQTVTRRRQLKFKKPLDPIPDEEIEIEEEEEEEEEEHVVEQEEEEEEDDDDKADDDDDEPIEKLLDPLSKEQLLSLLISAADSHPDVASLIRRAADEDPVHRKIFVHGLGWDATADTLREAFSVYGEIEDCKAVLDKITGKSKGYGFIVFKSRSGARKALKEPQKRIGNRMTACQLAAIGPVPANAGAAGPVLESTGRKIYVSNVSAEIDPQKLMGFFAKFGEIEEGPLGLDKQTGKFRGFCLFVYKTVEGAKKLLEEPHKNFEGHVLHCQQATDGPKNQNRNVQAGWKSANSMGFSGGNPAVSGAGHFLGQTVNAVPFNQGAAIAAQAALNPALGQALTALLATQGAGFGLPNLMGVNPAVQGVYGNQGGGSSGVLGGYGVQPGLQAAYQNQQLGQGSGGRSQNGAGHMGGAASYSGH